MNESPDRKHMRHQGNSRIAATKVVFLLSVVGL